MKRTLSILIAISALATIANANELVTNGGFETGDFTGWAYGATSGNIGINTPLAHSGTHSAAMAIDNVNGAQGFMEQTINLTQLLSISSFDVWINTEGATVTLDIQDGKGGLYEFDKTFGNTGRTWVDWNLLSTISGGSLTQISQIDFEVNGMNGGNNHKVLFDDVSLKTQAVPEPSSLLVLAPGLLLIAKRRKRG